MKKQIFLLFILLAITTTIVNCSGANDNDHDDEQTNAGTIQYFHSPLWIQGTWGINNNTAINALYKFTADDFILMAADGKEQSITKMLKASPRGGIVDETLNNSAQYNFIIRYGNTTEIQSFEFRKISETQIKCKDKNNGIWFDLLKL